MIRKAAALVLFLCVLLTGIPVFAQDLSLGVDDLLIELRADGGFHLFIRKKPDISSVLLTESTRDPAMAADNFAYRAKEWNPINGDEIRLLDGVPISRESRIFSLVSSTVVSHPVMGPAFHIYIPWVLEYGFPTGRHGEVHVTDGTYLNIRAFSLPYADYRGRFADNPFVLQALQIPPERPQGNFLPEAQAAFSEIARQGGGDFIYASDPAQMMDHIENILRQEAGNSVDIVLCIDTTGSMRPYIDEIRARLISMMRGFAAEFTDLRIGMVLYKDYYDEYLTRVISFTRDFQLFQRNLNAIQIRGGGDIPEAVYEAMYDGAERFSWAAESRLLVLIGDAPPHPRPRGRITKEMVFQKVEENGLKMSAILLPHP